MMISQTVQITHAQALLARAAVLYDDPCLPFAKLAREEGWKRGFISGAEWMRVAMQHVRGTPIAPVEGRYQRLGFIKYGLASLGALAWLLFCVVYGIWPLMIGVVPVFYAIETQMVFLFPCVIDGSTTPFHEGRMLMRRAGGTLAVMVSVLQFAVLMLFGGFTGRGFVRSWALGCLAVVLWYEDLRRA